MKSNRLSQGISAALDADAVVLVPSNQRQAAVKAAWAERQRAAGRTLWQTPRIFTFNQYCERALGESWSLQPYAIYVYNRSNIDLYSFRKAEGGMSLRRDFR